MKTQVLSTTLLAGLLLVAQASCGGTQADSAGGTPGQSHSTSDGDGETGSVDDVDSELNSTPESAPDAGVEAPVAPVTFVITNNGNDTLYLNMDRGLQGVISGYSGKIPNAKQLVLYPTHCTASCDSAPEDLCPVCEEPQRVKDIKAAEKHDPIEPGETREIPWDGIGFKDKRTKKGKRDGRRVTCNCFETTEPEPENYTIKACGLRKTQSAKARSKYPCIDATLTLPVTDPVRVEFDFGP